MAKSKTTPAKTRKKPASKEPVATAPRKLKKPEYKSFKVSKRIKHTGPKIDSAFKVFKNSLVILKQNWKIFLGITLIYGLLTIVLVRGIGGSLNLNELKSVIQEGFEGKFASLTTSAALFSYLVGSAGTSGSPTGGVYQTILIIVISLAIIWALRQVVANSKIKVRDTFYLGMSPLIPFILVLAVIGLQLIPLLAGSWLYSTVIGNGIAVSTVEKLAWALLFLLLVVLF